MGWLTLLACTGPVATDDSAVPVDLTPTAALLARWSLDTRGVRPSLADLDAVEADPDAAYALLDTYLADPRFGDVVASGFAPAWLVRADEADSADANYGLADEPEFLAAMGEEPLRLLGYIAASDLPYTDVVTGDWTMANEVLAEVYPTDYPLGETGWRRVSWTDNRPHVGALASNGLWWRYTTTTGNANRGRANAVARIFLCSDTQGRSIEVDTSVDLTNADAVQDALHTNPTCVACHTTLDPLGGFFWGFYVEFGTNPEDLTHYHPEREDLWRTYGGGVAPAYYGTPASGLADLGRLIADDPRFPTCVTQQAAEILLQRPVTLTDTDDLVAHREAFVQAGTLRALWRSILLDDGYRGGARMASADMYVSMVEDITGWRFEADGNDVYREDRFGLRSMAGGGRAVFGTGQVLAATPTMTLVHQRIAEAAAAATAAREHVTPGPLFAAEDFDTSTPDAGRIQSLSRRVLSRPPSSEEQEVLTTLWTALYTSEGSAEAAWAGVLATLLRHPDVVIY